MVSLKDASAEGATDPIRGLLSSKESSDAVDVSRRKARLRSLKEQKKDQHESNSSSRPLGTARLGSGTTAVATTTKAPV
jgi:hypothetical protein